MRKDEACGKVSELIISPKGSGKFMLKLLTTRFKRGDDGSIVGTKYELKVIDNRKEGAKTKELNILKKFKAFKRFNRICRKRETVIDQLCCLYLENIDTLDIDITTVPDNIDVTIEVADCLLRGDE